MAVQSAPSKTPVNESQRFMTKKQLAELLGLSVYTIDSWVSERREIPFVRMGRRVKFDRADIDEWVERQKVRPLEE